VDSFRTFIAIELGAEVRGRVMEHIKRLRRELPDVRASFGREDNLHLTLKFLGNVPVADIARVSDAVERATRSVSPFELTFSDCGTFPPHGRPSVLWVGAGSAGRGPLAGGPLGVLDILPATSAQPPNSSQLDRLYDSIEDELAEAGFPRDSRPFHPHLTIARLRHSQGARQLAELHRNLGFAPIAFDVSEVVVFRSELLKQGSKHVAISRHKLL
jgi:RNA 2',3'-cyclic 3'-phosphodiesterase